MVVTAENGNTFESDETEEVGVYEELEILSAEQTGAKTVALTFSDDVDADDKLEVKKGTKAVKIDSTTYGDAAAEITLTDKIVDGATYTVTLTPANGDPATSVEFVGEVASLGEIVFLNDVLVMADNKYSKGYCYVKGYDQYGDEINLSGLTVTPGVGKFESYDPKTGKITIDDGVLDGQTSPFMTIKEVPVFVQYQNGTIVLSAQANLTVSTMAYLADMEFGEIKKDGTPRDDGRLTVTELSSKKYYIEINGAKDQYGNELTSDDLNKQKDDSKTLFVIPNDTGAFYTTGQFATLKGQTILWLADAGADSKPGSMALTITGAGGATFTTDVEVENDPFIQSLNVTYPMLYPNVTKSDALDFTAVDQYGDAIDLWTVRPQLDLTDASNKTIVFTDKNKMTNRETTISLSGDVCFNDVNIDAANKSFSVTIDTTNGGAIDQAEKGDIISFVATTAGMQVSTASVTVGGEGTAAKIKADGKSVMLNANGKGGDTSYDFNGKIAFEDANGNTMSRDDADFPVYADIADLTTLNLASPNQKDIVGPFYWTLSSTKVTNSTAAAQVGTKGEYTVAEMAGAVEDIYAILVGGDEDGALVILDQQPFHFTQVTGTKEVSYTASCSDTLYVKAFDVNAPYVDDVAVKVIAKTEKGETYAVKAARITLGGIPFNTTNNTVYGDYDLDEVGSKTASVYVDGKQADSVTINYTNVAPAPAKTSYGFTTTDNGSMAASKYGTAVSGTAPETIYAKEGDETLTIAGGVLTLAGIDGRDDLYEDKVEAKIVDQYGQTVPTTKFTIDGTEITGDAGIAKGKHIIEYAAGSVTGRFTLEVQVTDGIPAANVTVTPTASIITLATATLAPGANTVTETALAEGTLYLLTQADYNTLVNNGTEPVGGIDSVAITAGDDKVDKTLTVPTNGSVKANTTYHLVMTDGSGAIQAHAAVKTAAAVATTVTLAGGFAEENLTTGNASTAVATIEDQFGNTMAIPATNMVSAYAGGTGTATATFAADANGRVTITVTAGATAVAENDTFSLVLGDKTLTATCQTTATNMILTAA